MTKSKIRHYSIALFFSSLILAFMGYAFMNPSMFGLGAGLCAWQSVGVGVECSAFLSQAIGQPLLLGMLHLAPLFLLLAVVPQSYDAWKAFAVWALPLFLISVLVSPAMGSSFSALPSRSMVALLLGQIFLTVSVMIMGYNWCKTKDC